LISTCRFSDPNVEVAGEGWMTIVKVGISSEEVLLSQLLSERFTQVPRYEMLRTHTYSEFDTIVGRFSPSTEELEIYSEEHDRYGSHRPV
jgi:hypothetical protein